MKPLHSNENPEKVVKITIGTLVAVVVLFISYLLAVLHRLEMMKELYKDVPSDDVVKDVTSNLQKILNAVTFFETLTYFLFAVCIIVLVFTGHRSLLHYLSHRQRSSVNDVPQNFADILTDTVLDPLELYKTNVDRIKQAQKSNDCTDRIALIYLYQSREGIIKPRTKSAYHAIFLKDVISNSQFSDKVKDIEDYLDNNTRPDMLKYKCRYKELRNVFNRFVKEINNSES